MTLAEYKRKWYLENRDKCRAAQMRYLYNGNKCKTCGKDIQRNSTYCVACLNKGEKSHFWKGGISSLRDIIRSIPESHKWSKDILKRDGYSCKTCGKSGGYLHAHHVYPFAKILKEFLKEYDQFSPIDDKETLVRLASKYKPFWDMDNGITLCPVCHKVGEHKWSMQKIQ